MDSRPDRALRVAILAWPAEEARRGELIATGTPRLLVLEDGVRPPLAPDDLEDWIWLPADERDVFARVRHLAARSADARLDRDAVLIDDDVAWVGGRTVHLPPVEATLFALLADPPEHMRTREQLASAVWGDFPHARRSLDSRIFSLRRRIAPLGLEVVAVRGRGFVLARPASRTSAG